MDRRQFLLGTTGVVAGCAGCSTLSSQSVTLNLVVFNHSEYSHRVEFELFRTDAESPQQGGPTNPEASVYFERIDVEPPQEVANGPSMTQRDAVAESRPYVVRYRVWREYGSSNYPGVYDEDHVHFFPPDDDGDSDAVIFDIYSEGEMERR
ncbi:hypothetical protein [Halorubellus litoreus]|uniref:Tat (Twin-arginine translocation) pathway signal sequence n=1 Tax=Halorubellus litoreus TaxID=755308 RepID=A0ABD5VPQ7_9EURY